MLLEFCKVRENSIAPTRAHPSDAGLDVFYSPENTSIESSVRIEPGENAALMTGLKFAIPHGYMLMVMNRSGMAVKRQLVAGAHCIDSGYSGEVFIDLHNVGMETQIVVPGTKIAQLVLVPVISFRPLEIEEKKLYSEPMSISNRGNSALGSSGDVLK